LDLHVCILTAEAFEINTYLAIPDFIPEKHDFKPLAAFDEI